jgi:spermidine synthase
MGKGANQPALDEFTMVLAAVLPLAYRPEIATAAAIGFGSGLTTATLLASPNIQRVDTIEIEPAMVDGARHFLPWVSRAYSDRRSRIIFDDAKSFFARGKERYDLIVSEPSNPWVSGTSSLFTQEFYSRIRGYLNDQWPVRAMDSGL